MLPYERALLKNADKGSIAVNLRRIAFYRRYGVLRVAGTAWESDPNPRNDYYRTVLLFDRLGRTARLARADARKAVRGILTAQCGYAGDDPFVEHIARSFADDPVKLEDLPGDDSPIVRC